MLGSIFSGVILSILRGALHIGTYQAGRMARGLPHTIGRLGARGAKGAFYRGAGYTGRHTVGRGARVIGKTVGDQFFKR